MAAEEFKVQLRNDVQFRDVIYTLNNVLTALSDTCQEDFKNGGDTIDTKLYPALTVTGSPSEDKGIKVASASKLSPGFVLSLTGDTTTSTQQVITGNKTVALETSLSNVNGVSADTIFDFSNKSIPFNAENVTTQINGINILNDSSSSQYIFKEDTSGVAGLIALRSVEADNFYKTKTVTFTGDVTGTLETDFSDDTTITSELKLGITAIDVTVKSRYTTGESGTDKWIPVKDTSGTLLYNQYTISGLTNIDSTSNITIIPNATTISELQMIKLLNLANGETDTNTVTIRSYGGYLPPTDIHLRLLINGKVVS